MEEAELIEALAQDSFNAHNGVRVVCAGDGAAKVVVTLTSASLNVWKIPHGGLLFAMADVASGAAATAGRDCGVVTLSGSVQFVRASDGTGTLHALARERRRGRTTGFYDVDITDDAGTLLATANFIMHYTSRAQA